MSKVIATTVYTFDELSDKAKIAARNWWLEGGLDYEWWDSVYEDAAQFGMEITAFDIDRGNYLKADFSKSAPEIADYIIENHGDSCDTHKLAKQFIAEYTGDEMNEAAFLRQLRTEYLSILRKEYEYLISDEHIDEAIRANEYTFTEDGKRFG